MTETFQFQTEQFTWSEVDLKGERKHYVEGFISTADKDDANEIVTETAQDKILAQVKGKIITMDIDHEEWVEDGEVLNKPKNTKIPVAKIVDAERRGNGVWVKAEINKHSERFSNIWGSIKSKFLHSFSIAFYPLKAITKSINGVVHRFVEDLNLINVTLTGSPVNANATFVPVMKAALKSIEESNMSEENKQPEAAPVEAAPVAEQAPKVEETQPEIAENNENNGNINKSEDSNNSTSDDNVNILNDSVADLTKQIEEQKAQIAQLNKQLNVGNENISESQVQEVLAEPLAQIKSLNAEVAKLKAELKKPVIKATQEEMPQQIEKDENPLDKIL